MTELDKKVLKLLGLMMLSLDILDEMESSEQYQKIFVKEMKRDHNNFKKRLEKVVSRVYPKDDIEADKQMVAIHRAVSELIDKGLVISD
jgi:hypothetical protein